MNGFELNIGTEMLKRMDEADKKLQQIATHSEEVSKAMKKLSTDGINSVVNGLSKIGTQLSQLSQNKGFTNMGTQASQSVDAINKLVEALAKLTTQQQLRLQTQQAKVDYKKEANDLKELAVAEDERTRALNRQNKANIANDKHRQALETKKLANDTKELMNIEQERGRQLILQNKQSIAAYTKQSVKLKQQIDEINRLAKAYKQLPKSIKQGELNKLITSASKAKTINQHIVAIHNLNNALRDLDTKSAKYKDNVRRINEEIARNQMELAKLGVNLDSVRNKKRKLMDTAGQLGRSLALIFSVSHIIGYINQMVNIRREMELQHRSLQVLIQDRYEADKLWQQTVDLAVRSPFRVKELVTYTRQLAAYRIETDKLHDTTRRLADVSSGLGVDMNRLILAYGQVRAAEYLRGTELRQFSEAGIPMLDELAKYFSKLEDRAVSAGDVFERVSKRMVSFEDVNEVFQRMTNKGGVFFQMQEKQSETLHGIISNFHDSVDLMLNDLGAANDGRLKGTVLLFRDFVQNWRFFAEILTQIGTIAVISILRKQILNLLALSPKIYALAGSLTSLNVVSRALNISIIRFVGSLKALGAAMLTPHGILIGFVATLASAISGFMAWQKAIDASNEKYDKLSEREANSIRNLQEINDAIKKNNSIIKDSNAAIESKTKAEKDNASQLDVLKSKYPEVYKGLIRQKDGTIDATKTIEQQNEILRINIALQQQAKGGMFQDDFSENYQDALKEYQRVVSSVTKVQSQALQGIVGLSSALQSGDISKDTFNSLSKLFGEFAKAETFDDIKKLNEEFADFQKTLLSNQSEYTSVIKLTNGLRNAYSGLFDAQSDYSYHLDNWFDNINNQMDAFVLGAKNKLASVADDNLGKSLAGDWVTEELTKLGVANEELLKKAQAYVQLKLSDLQIGITFKDDGVPVYNLNEHWRKKIWDAIEYIQSTNPDIRLGVSLKEMATKGKSELVKKIKESVENQIKLNDETIEVGKLPSQLVFSEQQVSAAQKVKPLLKELAELVGVIIEKSSKESSVKILNNRINLIKELNKEYEKLNKTFDNTTSKEKVLESFGDTFKQAFEGTGISLSSMVINTEALSDLRNSGKLAGKALTDSTLEEIERLKEAGTYIRSFDDDFVASIKYLEGLREKAYQDAGGVWTQGYGETINIERDKVWSEEKATLVLRDSLTKRYVSQLNQILDDNKELVLTQKQYNALLDLTYQGGKGAAISLLERTRDIGKGVEYINTIAEKIKETMGEKYAERFGESFVNKFKEAESVYERIAMLLEVSNLTIKGGINKEWYQGMQKRSDERASLFRGDLETSKALEDILVSISDIDFTNIEGVIHQLKQLAPLAKKEGKEAELALSKAISELEVQVGIKTKAEDDKALIDQIEEMFSGYEMSIELQKLNIPPDLAKQLFNIDALTLPELKSKVVSMESKFVGTDMEEEYRKFLKKIDEMEDKQNIERLEKFVKFLAKTSDEIANVQKQGALDITYAQNLFLGGKIDAEKYSEIIKNVVNEVNKDISKINLEKFKESPEYIAAMGDMAGYTISELSKLSDKIRDLISENAKSMTPDEIKAYNDALNKINEQVNKIKSPFGKSWLSELREINALEKELTKEKEKQLRLQQELQNKQASLVALNKKLAELQARPQSAGRDIQIQGVLNDITQVQKGMSNINGQLNTTAGNISSIGGKLEKVLGGMGSSVATVDKVVKGISQSIDATITVFNDFKDLMDSFGVDTDTAAWQDITLAMETLGEVNQKATQGWEDLKNGNVAGAVANTLGVVMSVIKGINKIHDAKYERRIQREIKLVEDLERAYKKLEKQIDKAYEFDTLKGSYDAAQKNIDAQIESYNKMIAAEEDKKKTDKDKIKEWQIVVEDLKEQQRELLETQVEELGGSYDFSSITEEFVNAWLDAFKDTGNGLKGLEENFEDFWTNIALKQAVMGGASKIMQPLLDAVNKALEDDFKLDESEMSNIDQLSQKAKEEMNLFLQQWYDRWGDFIDKDQGDLSGLQRGIQELTESTGQEIAAYLNSIRFFVAEQTTYLSQIASSFGNTEVENPMVEQLRIIAAQTSAINSLLQGLVRGGHSLGGSGLKVFIS